MSLFTDETGENTLAKEGLLRRSPGLYGENHPGGLYDRSRKVS
jgi:hypothetical protein